MRILKWVSIAIVLALLACGGAVYLLANRIPGDYRPSRLSPQQRELRAEDFVNHTYNGFANGMEGPDPFTFTVTEDEINGYLASLDEIAYLRPGAKQGDVGEALQRAGLADPAVCIRDGSITFMIRSTDYDKVLSASMESSFPSPGRLQVHLTQGRIGALPLPGSVLRQRLEQFQSVLRDAASQGGPYGPREAERLPKAAGAAPGGKSAPAAEHRLSAVEDAQAALLKVIQAIDREPISTVLPVKANGRTFCIDGIEMTTEGGLSIHVSPVGQVGPSTPRP